MWRYFYENCSSFEEFIKNCTGEVEAAKGALYSFAYNQLDYLEDGDGSILVDFIGRFENFSEDLHTFAMKAGDPVRADHACQRFGPPALQHLLHIGAREDRQRTIRKRHRVFWI